MKKIILLVFLFSCIIWGCKNKNKESQAGVYNLEKQTVSGGKRDSTYERKQIKIYTDKYFLYAGMAPDSSVGFGVGSYTLNNNNITENNIYSGQYLDSSKKFDVTISKTSNGYSQIIPNLAEIKGVKYKLTEVYSKIPSADTSILDGVWKLDKVFWVKGKDTLKQNETQYKIFWGGHFIFIHRYPLDAAGKTFKNGFGYGTFRFKNDTLSEDDEISSHRLLVGRKFAIKIRFNGNDEYSQVINDPKAQQQTTEIYRRLK